MNLKAKVHYPLYCPTYHIVSRWSPLWLWRKRFKSVVSTMRGITRSCKTSFQTQTSCHVLYFAKQPCMRYIGIRCFVSDQGTWVSHMSDHIEEIGRLRHTIASATQSIMLEQWQKQTDQVTNCCDPCDKASLSAGIPAIDSSCTERAPSMASLQPLSS